MAKKKQQAKVIEHNLAKEIKAIKGAGLDGLLEGSFIVLRTAQQRVPRENGDLFRSGYARKAQNKEMATEVGFTAKYAAAIHEKLEMKWQGKPRRSGKGVYWGPAGRTKYLSSAVQDEKKRFLDAVRKRAAQEHKRRAKRRTEAK